MNQDKPPPHLLRVPVLEEQLQVHKAVEPTGAVRVRIVPREVLQTLEIDTTSEEVEVQRVPRGLPVKDRQPARQEGDLLIVPVYEEVVTVQRRWVLKEELHVRRKPRRRTERLQVPVLREEAVVERRQADGTWRTEDEG